jgi:hypothetical protein
MIGTEGNAPAGGELTREGVLPDGRNAIRLRALCAYRPLPKGISAKSENRASGKSAAAVSRVGSS